MKDGFRRGIIYIVFFSSLKYGKEKERSEIFTFLRSFPFFWTSSMILRRMSLSIFWYFLRLLIFLEEALRQVSSSSEQRESSCSSLWKNSSCLIQSLESVEANSALMSMMFKKFRWIWTQKNFFAFVLINTKNGQIIRINTLIEFKKLIKKIYFVLQKISNQSPQFNFLLNFNLALFLLLNGPNIFLLSNFHSFK